MSTGILTTAKALTRTVDPVNMERLAEQVPPAHLQLVLLHGAGVDDSTIAAYLEIPGEAFEAMLEVATAKILAAFELVRTTPERR